MISTNDFNRDDIKQILNNYIVRLKKKIIIYSIKHPLVSFKKARDKLSVIYSFLKYPRGKTI